MTSAASGTRSCSSRRTRRCISAGRSSACCRRTRASMACAAASRGTTARRRSRSCASSRSCATGCCRTSTPWPGSGRDGDSVVRPLVLEYPDDPVAATVDYEYLLGPDLLVAPVMNPEGRALVYLPEGEWRDWWTDEVTRGPAHLRLEVPIERLPLYARVGDGDSVGAGDGLRRSRRTLLINNRIDTLRTQTRSNKCFCVFVP